MHVIFRVLGGIVLILLVVALSTCIKNRRNMMEVKKGLTVMKLNLRQDFDFLSFVSFDKI